MTTAFPTLFVTHGAPTLPLEPGPCGPFLRELGSAVPRPRAILCISAHWDTRACVCIGAAAAPKTIHDFSGFPEALYRMNYPAPGAPALAGRVSGLLMQARMNCLVDPLRGLDHGAWVPLQLMFPGADIPVATLSVSSGLSAAQHLAIGAALAPLREEGVLILGSGSATYNLADFGRAAYNAPPHDYVRAFDDWLVGAVEAGDTAALAAWEKRAPQARRNHPTDEHFLPLFPPLGAAGANAKGRTLHRSYTYGILAMTAFGWGM
jgi:4,5-DOPA dioxygenase extradiol